MRKTILFACLAGLAAPAAAHPPGDRPDLARNLPRGEDVAAMAPVLDRSVNAMLGLDIGPMMDAADPLARHPGYGRPGRTLRELGRRDDPYFEQRLRGSIYAGTAQLGRMMDAFAASMPAMQRSIEQMEDNLADAIHAPPPPPPPGAVDDDWDLELDDPYYEPDYDPGYDD